MKLGRDSQQGRTTESRGLRRSLAGLAAAVALTALLLAAPTASAAVFTVRSTGDSLGPCDALCTLRSAISGANANPGTDHIFFDIAPSGVQTIQPGSTLPEITDIVVIDGTTQPGFAGSPIIELDGTLAGGSTNGITIATAGGGSTIRGLVVNRFARGILIGSIAPGGIGSSNNVIAGNYIGTDVTGTLDRGNAFQGVMITPRDAADNRIGGSSAADRNVISGNGQQGVVIEGQGGGPGANTVTSNRVWGNYIGTNASGTGALGNSHYGISISNALNSEIGGSNPALRNVISSNLGGVVIGNFNSAGNRIEGNYIGTDVNGTSPLGNTQHGVSVSFTTGINTVGGTLAGTGNVLAHNFRNGVFAGGNGNGLPVVGNSIHSNGELGIDLNPSGNGSIFGNGVTPNDGGPADDADAGGNDLQNFPFITSATSSGGTTAMEGGLNSRPNRTYRIEFFSNPACDSSGNGEGRTFLGSFNSTTDGNGDVGFGGATVPTAVASGDKVTATATDLSTSETSEFSACATAVAGDPATFTVNSTADTDDGSCTAGDCTLREAINRANAVAGHDTISFGFTGPGPHTITPGSQLPQITEAATVDGTSQPGYSGTPLVELDGGSAGSSSAGLILSGGSTAKGLVINRFNTQVMVVGSGNVVESNFLGTNAAGTAAPPAGGGGNSIGVNLIGSGNRIGGTTAAARNVISGSASRGIWVGTTGNEIQGNYIGTDRTGTDRVPNFLGVEVDAPNTVVGGTTGVSPGGSCTGACNVISGNQIAGVVFRSGSFGGHVEGNFIGTDPTGSAPVLNQTGVWLDGSPNNTVGGTTIPERNVLSGNSISVFIYGSTATGNNVEGNFIGTNSTGTSGLGVGTGVSIHTSAHDNTIGGSASGARNVISGNADWGVLIGGDGTGNQVKGNFIGTDPTGTSGIGNAQGGIQLQASGGVIGGIAAGDGNTIAFNSGPGVSVFSGTSDSVLGNSIHSNAGLGIDLGQNGVTQNDSGDGDPGPNNLQNFPELTSASPDSSTTVRGTLDTQPGTYRLEFFSNTSCDPSGFGEGQTFEGSQDDFVAGGGSTPFTVVLSNTLPLGSFVTATATDVNGNTSELSECIEVAPAESADLRITKSDSPDPVTAGTDLNYTLTVTNDGPSEAPNVTLTDDLPSGLSNAQYCTGSGCTPNTAWTGSLDLGTVASGSSVVVRIRATCGSRRDGPDPLQRSERFRIGDRPQ